MLKNFSLSSLIILMFSIGNLSAQNQELLHKYHLVKGDAIRVMKAEDLNVTGSPYYNNDFQPAHVHFPEYPPILTMVRYDMIKEEMQVLIDNENYQVLENNVIVEIRNKFFQKLDYIGDNRETNIGYFEIPQHPDEDPGLLLLQKHSKELKTNERSQARGFPAKYVEKTEHYLKFSRSRPAVIVQPRLSNFLEAFPLEHREDLKAYITKNKLNHKKENDLASIVNYYNSQFNN